MTTGREEFAMCAIWLFTEREKMYKDLHFWFFWGKAKRTYGKLYYKGIIRLHVLDVNLKYESNLKD